MKRIVSIVVMAAVAQCLAVQGLAAQDGGPTAVLSRELARTDFYSAGSGARIEVIVTDDAAAAVRAADTGASLSNITAYGVRLLSDSSQDGRANAVAAMSRFEAAYPGVEISMSYEIPAFWVTAGNFVDRLDAVALCGKVQAQFPRAFVVPMEVPVARIIASERAAPVSLETPAEE
ncbi:MAG: hypothetical protein LBU98_05940 [Alistipes sp.]|jgi:hypothetical protein|nr:hypothetical protein [Alistipes sp.]